MNVVFPDYDGDDEVQEILRIAREQGWSYGK